MTQRGLCHRGTQGLCQADPVTAPPCAVVLSQKLHVCLGQRGRGPWAAGAGLGLVAAAWGVCGLVPRAELPGRASRNPLEARSPAPLAASWHPVRGGRGRRCHGADGRTSEPGGSVSREARRRAFFTPPLPNPKGESSKTCFPRTRSPAGREGGGEAAWTAAGGWGVSWVFVGPARNEPLLSLKATPGTGTARPKAVAFHGLPTPTPAQLRDPGPSKGGDTDTL